MARLIHLNGPPGIGKSTIARRYAADHPGVLVCDIDVLRTLIGGWSDDFGRAGALIRPAALAMIEAYLSSGHDVVLPQLLLDPAELARFEGAAARAHASFVERFLLDDPARAAERFGRRGEADPDDPWHEQVRDIVADQGGAEALREWAARLAALAAARPGAVVVPSLEGDPDDTYEKLLASLA
jgi:predicted kinase